MQTCPVCDFRNPDINTRCFKCNALLKDDPEEVARAIHSADKKREWGATVKIQGLLESALRQNRLVRLWRDTPADLPHRFPFTAAGLSILPGLGQIYNHQYMKALIFAAAWLVYLAVCVATITNPFSNYLLLGLLLFWVLIWNDALVTSVRINRQNWPLRNTFAAWFALLFIAGIVITAAQWLVPAMLLLMLISWSTALSSLADSQRDHWTGSQRSVLFFAGIIFATIAFFSQKSHSTRLFTFVRLFKSVHAPVLDRGDVILVNNVAYWYSEPQPGDLIHFDPPRFSMENASSGDVYAINISDYFQRVLGIAGDTVEKRDGKFFRNGSPLPESTVPIGVEFMPDGKWKVPPDKVFAPVTRIPFDVVTGLLAAQGPDHIFTPGLLMKGWEDSIMVPISSIYGRGVCIMNPPTHRRWLN
jgi:signal peptidase I